MVYTTGPGYIISIIAYIILGLRFSGGELETGSVETILSTLESNFFIHPILLLPPCLVIVMVIKKIPPLPALFGGTILGGIFAMATQSKSLGEVIQAANTGFISQTGVEFVDDLLTRGGLQSMMATVALIICALSFGGIMERTGMLETLARSLLKRVKRTGSLVTMTIFSCIGMNAIASDQYMAIVIPGRMYKNAFDSHGLHPKNLSRRGEFLSIDRSQELCPENRHVFGVSSADEKMAFIGAGTASHADIHEDPQRPESLKPLSEALQDDLFPVFRQFPVFIERRPFPRVGHTHIFNILGL